MVVSVLQAMKRRQPNGNQFNDSRLFFTDCSSSLQYQLTVVVTVVVRELVKAQTLPLSGTLASAMVALGVLDDQGNSRQQKQTAPLRRSVVSGSYPPRSAGGGTSRDVSGGSVSGGASGMGGGESGESGGASGMGGGESGGSSGESWAGVVGQVGTGGVGLTARRVVRMVSLNRTDQRNCESMTSCVYYIYTYHNYYYTCCQL